MIFYQISDIKSEDEWGKNLNGINEQGQARNNLDFSGGTQKRRPSKVRWDLMNNVRNCIEFTK